MVSWGGLTLTVGAILIAVDLPYRSAELADGAWALLAYPKLYGALLLWGLALVSCLRSGVSHTGSRPATKAGSNESSMGEASAD